MKSAYLVILLAVAVTTPAILAKVPDCSPQFREEGKAVPRALLRMGIRHFGPLDLNENIRATDRVRVKPGGNQNVQTDFRSTARWTIDDGVRTVNVDCAWYRRYGKVERSILAFHEFVWSAGFYDEWYWLSLTGWLYTQKSFRELLRAEELADIRRWMGDVAAVKGGGIVGVGGGGEVESVSCGLRFIEMVLIELKKSTTEAHRQRVMNALADTLEERRDCSTGARLDGGRATERKR